MTFADEEQERITQVAAQGQARALEARAHSKPCRECGALMLLGQKDRHFVCDPSSKVGSSA